MHVPPPGALSRQCALLHACPLGGDLAHAAASRSVKLGRGSSVGECSHAGLPHFPFWLALPGTQLTLCSSRPVFSPVRAFMLVWPSGLDPHVCLARQSFRRRRARCACGQCARFACGLGGAPERPPWPVRQTGMLAGGLGPALPVACSSVAQGWLLLRFTFPGFSMPRVCTCKH